jgi:hypothetical protein
VEQAMSKGLLALFVVLLSVTNVSYAEDWNLVKNVRRIEQVTPEYKDDKVIDKKFLDVLDLTEKTKKGSDVYDEAKRIAVMPTLTQSKYMDSFLYYMLVWSTTLSKNSATETDYWLGQLKTHEKSPHLLAAWLVYLKQLPKDSPIIRQETQSLVSWIKAQKPAMQVRAPEYSRTLLMNYKPRIDFADGDYPKTYTLSHYMSAVTPSVGFLDDDIYITLLDRLKDGREDILTEMSDIYRKMGKRNEASDIFYQLAKIKVNAKDFQKAKPLLDEAVKFNPKNAEAVKERDRIKLELTYQSLAPAATPTPEVKPGEAAAASAPESSAK